MPKSPSNKALLVEDLRAIVILYREKPSTLLAEFEEFLDSKGIGVGQHRREIEKEKRKASLGTRKWEILGFESEKALKEFEARPDFPGWDAL